MATNHWLKKFKEARRRVSNFYVALLTKEGNFWIPSYTGWKHKRLTLRPKWYSTEFNCDPVVYGVAIRELSSGGFNTVWQQQRNPVALTGSVVGVCWDFSGLKIDTCKWTLDQLLQEEDE